MLYQDGVEQMETSSWRQIPQIFYPFGNGIHAKRRDLTCLECDKTIGAKSQMVKLIRILLL